MASKRKPGEWGPRRSYLPEHLLDVLTKEAGANARLLGLFEDFLARERYDPAFAARLVQVARSARERWGTRCLAILMLENQALRIPPGAAGPIGGFLSLLGLTPARGLATFTTLRRRIARLRRIHEGLDGTRTRVEALRGFLHVARGECKLTLARHLLTPGETAARIERLVRTSRGIPEHFLDIHPRAPVEAERALRRLPAFEAELAASLRESSHIYWVAETPCTELNALVEYPVGTVALVVKPPGSDIELELKRAGRPAPLPLGVVFRRDGAEVPPTHRLDGGSMRDSLQQDAGASAMFATVHREVHGEEAPIPRMLSIRSMYSIPTPDGARHVLDYFTDPQVFGPAHRGMRAAMAHSLAAFQEQEDAEILLAPRGPLGLTARFLHLVAPSQALLVGTTSYRLDRTADHLSARGPALYFAGRAVPSRDAARHFADDVLEEVLGELSAPATAYVDHEQYVAAALAVPRNRARADRLHLAALRRIGTFWGTLLGMRGCSHGESLVGRNVGLKSAWTGRAWTARLVFMDHDNLRTQGEELEEFRPRVVLRGIEKDRLAVHGGIYKGSRLRGIVELLETIYRVDPERATRGRRELERAMARAYRDTQARLLRSRTLRPLFSPTFLERLRDWDVVVARRLQEPGEGKAWRDRVRSYLRQRGYSARRITEHVVALDEHIELLREQAFLFPAESRRRDG